MRGPLLRDFHTTTVEEMVYDITRGDNPSCPVCGELVGTNDSCMVCTFAYRNMIDEFNYTEVQ